MEAGDRMTFWLFKSEPDVWGWDHQVAKGDEGEEWHGVRNYQARNNMRAMKVGDRGFFYHSNVGQGDRRDRGGVPRKLARQHDG
jgi:predicted RNA-binding protein with PUA-like domain